MGLPTGRDKKLLRFDDVGCLEDRTKLVNERCEFSRETIGEELDESWCLELRKVDWSCVLLRSILRRVEKR